MYLFQPGCVQCARTCHYFIYIPLCIYFNWGRMLRDILLRINLHSTMYLFQPCAITGTTLLPIHLHSTMYLFQQIYLKHIINRHINLHSTMYLFQPDWFYLWICSRRIYIPLCIYFNCILLRILQGSFANLHSTMYLFQL